MRVSDFANHILSLGSLENKLLDSEIISDYNFNFQPQRFSIPVRDEEIAFSDEQLKFPKKGALKNERERGKALHFFANHELLAIEMMAQALLLFPEMGERSQKLLLKTLSEEQTHLKLYISRMNELGIKFGDYPLNNFFWSYMDKVETLPQFFSVISLTFEQANLDFCLHYKRVFAEVGDEKSANVLETIYQDEIKHVARGRLEVDERKKEDDLSLWNYYKQILPEPLTPARAKGIGFDKEGRKKAGLQKSFVENLETYKDNFSVTNRRQWKK
ncbi:MAG: ferritin-like domain-containing protein [Halobacteriovoraceae bacterium]|nr:ferritin-like domain-containing protein [Halobacteriovoraceae bacterium]